jgi:hypothetical protein
VSKLSANVESFHVHPKSFLQQTAPPTHVLYRDYETRSPVDLQRAGAWKYAPHPNTEVMCCAYAVDDDPPEIWVPGTPIPHAFTEAAHDPTWLIVAHNAAFEIAIEELLTASSSALRMATGADRAPALHHGGSVGTQFAGGPQQSRGSPCTLAPKGQCGTAAHVTDE